MPLPRYRSRTLRQLGAVTERKRPVRRLTYAAVAKRAKGCCELCDFDVEHAGLRPDPHHAFGRGTLPGIPASLCESRELVLSVCRECHDRIHDGDQALANEARGMAILRFCAHHGLAERLDALLPLDPVDIMRELVRILETRA